MSSWVSCRASPAPVGTRLSGPPFAGLVITHLLFGEIASPVPSPIRTGGDPSVSRRNVGRTIALSQLRSLRLELRTRGWPTLSRVLAKDWGSQHPPDSSERDWRK